MTTDLSFPSATTVRRWALLLMTLVAGLVMGSALLASWQEPQVASRLELYQADLMLKATAWQGSNLPEEQVALIRQNLLGATPLAEAEKTYQAARKTAISALESAGGDPAAVSPRLQTARVEQANLLSLLDLRLGILAAEQGNTVAAVEYWQAVQSRQAKDSPTWRTAAALIALWQTGRVLPGSKDLFQSTLQGWFLNRTLAQVYTVTQETAALAQLSQAEAEAAEHTLLILALVGGVPVLGALLGSAVVLGVGVQRLLKGPQSLLARHRALPWKTPWGLETLGWVMVGGFLLMGQLIVPLLVSPLRGSFAGQGIRGQALFALLYYLLMAAGTISVLWGGLRSHRPLPPEWFVLKFNAPGLAWGLGGYFAALPLMLLVSLLNQQIWQGQGGSNPLLQTVLEANDWIALGLFFATAAIAAPLFEEFLFRGFLLPSLTRYLPVWGAIGLSSFIFAVAHLSLSEVLPLMTLGIILGVVYTRSRNLLAPMVLHSLWNSVTMIGLFLLGSSVA